MKLLKENKGINFPNTVLWNDSLIWQQNQREREKQRDTGKGGRQGERLHQTENFCTAKETINRGKMQGNLQDEGKVFANHIPDQGLLVKIQKEFLQFNSKKQIS